MGNQYNASPHGFKYFSLSLLSSLYHLTPSNNGVGSNVVLLSGSRNTNRQIINSRNISIQSKTKSECRWARLLKKLLASCTLSCNQNPEAFFRQQFFFLKIYSLLLEGQIYREKERQRSPICLLAPQVTTWPELS